MSAFEFEVVGFEPRPQGSKRIGRSKDGRPIILADNDKRLKVWRRAVVAAARSLAAASPHCPFEGPVILTVVFSVTPPAKVPKDRRGWPSVRPDKDKMERAVCDALTTAGVWKDDDQVCCSLSLKVYAGGPPPSLPSPGARIRVARLEELESLPNALDEALRQVPQVRPD